MPVISCTPKELDVLCKRVGRFTRNVLQAKMEDEVKKRLYDFYNKDTEVLNIPDAGAEFTGMLVCQGITIETELAAVRKYNEVKTIEEVDDYMKEYVQDSSLEGSFLYTFCLSYCKADFSNKRLLLKTARGLIAKYKLKHSKYWEKKDE